MTFEKTCFFDVGPTFFDRERTFFFSSYLSLSATRYCSHTHAPTHAHRRERPPTAFSSVRNSYCTHTSCTYVAAAAVYKFIKKKLQLYIIISNVFRIAARQNRLIPTTTPRIRRTTDINSIVLKPYIITVQVRILQARALYTVRVTIYAYASEPIVIEHEGDLRRIRYTPPLLHRRPYRVWATVFSSTHAFTTIYIRA